MAERMSREQFEATLADREIERTLETIGQTLERYSGAHIHQIPNLRQTIFDFPDRKQKGRIESTTFEQWKDENRQEYDSFMDMAYEVFARGAYNI